LSCFARYHRVFSESRLPKLELGRVTPGSLSQIQIYIGMKYMMQKTLLILGSVVGLCLVIGCSSPRVAMEGVRLNMDKTQVLDAAGNPHYTYRSDDQDHWVYLFVTDDREWTRTVTFDKGKVLKIGKAQTKDAAMKELENTSTLEEFEAKGRAMQKAKVPPKFKAIDGGKDD
jgi:outer membrane protein assembly factor BamE (lipoprotein component of BamABCDE complex)